MICLYLLYATSLFDKAAGTIILLAGVLIYVFFSPKQDIYHLKELFLSEQAIFMRAMAKRERFLGNFMLLLYRSYMKIKQRIFPGRDLRG